MRSFRAERVATILSGETPVPMDGSPKAVLHVVPESAMTRTGAIDPRQVSNISDSYPIVSAAHGSRYNADGLLSYREPYEGHSELHDQVFRNGAVEVVDGDFTAKHEGRTFVVSVSFEKQLMAATPKILGLLSALEIRPPAFVFVSLLGVRGAAMALPPRLRRLDHRFDRDNVLLPEIVISDFDEDIGRVLRPVLDGVWQAAGHAGSLYDDAGNWREP